MRCCEPYVVAADGTVTIDIPGNADGGTVILVAGDTVEEQEPVEPSSLDAIDQAMTDESLSDFYDTIGEVTDDGKFTIAGQELTVDEALEAWKAPLEGVFATRAF